jgi:hypothetical protein
VRKICEAIPAGALTAWDEGVDFSIFARPAASPKTVMNYLLAIAVRGHQQQLFIHLLEFSNPDPERCFKAEALLASQTPFCPAYSEFMRGERAYMIAAITSMLEQEDPSNMSSIISGESPARGWGRVERAVRRYGPVGWLKQNLANSVRGTGELIEAFDASVTPDAQWKGLARVDLDSESQGSLFHWMEKATIGIYSGLFGSVIRSDATRNLLRSALIIAAHRSRTGIAPMSLDELPTELRSRIPASPLKNDLPRIKRNDAGVWTLAYGGFDDPRGWEPEWTIQIRGW